MAASVGPWFASTVGECVATSPAAPAGRRGKRTPNSAPAAHAQRGKLRVRSRARLYPTGLANHGGARMALTAAAVIAETLAEQPGNMGSSISSRSLPSAGGGGRGIFSQPFLVTCCTPLSLPRLPANSRAKLPSGCFLRNSHHRPSLRAPRPYRARRRCCLCVCVRAVRSY